MAPLTAHKATQRLIACSYGSWAKGSCLAFLPPEYQRRIVLPFFQKPVRHFSLLQRLMTTTSKPKALSTTSKPKALRTTSKPKALSTTSKPKALSAQSLTSRSNIGSSSCVKSVVETVTVSSRQLWAKCGWVETGKQWRGFSMTTSTTTQLGMGKGDTGPELGQKTPRPGRGDDWALRLANENGFLSWCRNCYLTTVVAIAIMAEATTPLALQAAEGAFFVAGLNLTWGTYQYVYNLLRLRLRTGMSAVGVLTYISMAMLHLALWFIVCTTFLGYVEEPESRAREQGQPGGRQGDDV